MNAAASAAQPRVLLIVGGGIAAYKSCELVRLIRKGGGEVTCVVTEGGQQFVTPMALAALSEHEVYTSLWDLKNEVEMGHIELSREADLVVVCPATADLVAKMAAGIADDLATTLLLATDKPVMAVPAMNVKMWEHEATQRNIGWLREAGVEVLDPDEGPMACGEFGYGRLPEPHAIWAKIAAHFDIEVEEPEVVEVAQVAAAGVRTEEDELLESLEPEPEVVPKGGGGLGGLLSSIIPRSTAKRSAEEIEAQELEEEEAARLAAEAAAEAEDEAEDQVEAEEVDADAEPDLAEPDLGGPLMATKGGAKAAPPIDPEAINHEVSDRQSAPEPMADEGEAEEPAAIPADVEVKEEDALGGEQIKVKKGHRPLDGKHVLITAGPTWEAIDPVRYIANRSSGKQGFAIAACAAALGAKVTLVAGPVSLKTPEGVDRINVESAQDMSEAVKDAMPADAAIMVAAVADWRPKEYRAEKMKKRGSAPPALVLTENPDILTNIGASDKRPPLVVGFAAETEDVIDNAKRKRKRKAADWIVANDVSGDVMGGDENRVHVVTEEGVESLEQMPKIEVAMALLERVADRLNGKEAAE